MVDYLLKLLIFIISGAFIIYNYYFVYGGHNESFTGYFPYVVIIGIIYSIYKYLQMTLSSKKAIFSPLSLFNYFLLHLFILCMLFFTYNKGSFLSGIVLFFKILVYSFLPIIIILISISFGKKILSISNIPFLDEKKEDNKILVFLTSLGIGFFSFLFLLTIIGLLGFYNFYAVSGIILCFFIFSYKQLFELINGLFSYKIEFNLKSWSHLKLITGEFLYIVSTFLLSVNLINIVRPFPIGWDDLGVYMNHPHLLAEAGSIISLGLMASWQVFTGIGYMLNSPTQAFFLNNVGGILSFISLVLIISDFLKSSSKKETFINIPLLIGTVFISMPMVIFQQAKDMKLDPGLFFVSIICLYILFKFYLFEKQKEDSILISGTKKILGFFSSIKNTFKKDKGNFQELEDDLIELKNIFSNKNIYIFLIIGILAGFAFSIKLTSIFLISAIIGIIFFARLGLSGFLGYLAIYYAIFTKFNLWSFMQITINSKDGNIGFILSSFLGILFLTLGILANRQKFKVLCFEILIFLTGIILSVLPWLGKNIYDTYPKISIGTLISGKVDTFEINFEKIYSKSEIEEIQKKSNSNAISSSGTSSDADFGRYFGYEKGINNYVKLPWNLTMQKNQGGEFTDIGVIYLIFFPLILLFLPFRNKYYYFSILLFYLLEILLFFNTGLTDLMSKIMIPFGYSIIFLLFLIPIILSLFILKDTNKNYLIKLNLIFINIYVFLWTLAAFGIVWYGITMYFSFLLIIAIGIYYLSNFNDQTEEKEKIFKLYGSIIVFFIFLFYAFSSIIPHGFKNLAEASYTEYKLGQITVAESSFLYHPEYLKIMFELNISDETKAKFIEDNITSEVIKGSIKEYNVNSNINLALEILKQYQADEKIPGEIKLEAKRSTQKIYAGIMNPKKEYKNKTGIYRIGTFLKYHISENNIRLLEDSMIYTFNNYIYNEDTNKTIENLKKLGLKYLLVDLNAATIDKDPKHDLTNRYEKLLSTYISDKLELIETDSVCLKVGLEDYAKTKDITRFMTLAGVNYESYKESKVINRTDKAIECYKYINNLMKNNLITQTDYPYLIGIRDYITQYKDKLDTEEKIISFLHQNIGNSFKALFKIK